MWTPERSFADAEPVVYWTSQTRPVAIQAPLESDRAVDLVVIGGGFTGLWAAIDAKRRDPSRDVVLLEMEEIAFGATGRNGGFIDSSLTHGLENGLARYSPSEMRTLIRLGDENFEAIAAFVDEHQVDCDLVREGTLWGATEPYMLDGLSDVVALYNDWVGGTTLLDRKAIQR